LWLRALLGLDPQQPKRLTSLHPSLPASITRLHIDGLRVGDAVLSVDVAGERVEVSVDGDLKVVTKARGPVTTIIEPPADDHG
jgi:hypothetical protein